MSTWTYFNRYVEYGDQGYLNKMTRGNITQHCDWTPSIGLEVRINFNWFCVVIWAYFHFVFRTLSSDDVFQIMVDKAFTIDHEWHFTLWMLCYVYLMLQESNRESNLFTAMIICGIVKIVLHFTVYVTLHHRLECLDTARSLLKVQTLAWIEQQTRGLLRTVLPDLFK